MEIDALKKKCICSFVDEKEKVMCSKKIDEGYNAFEIQEAIQRV
jgi:hypothetical protein